ncbi:hypothetical protein F5Y06DRAFT_285729 [Hypoxylon sp. FL0890]|nr:hypothetical protein F5Y06DRAFT_285729 [Hypoxylon sp. FL0890]
MSSVSLDDCTRGVISSSGRHQWVPSPNTRGTFDIIWPCISTLVLCLWTMLHLNVPAPDDGYTTRFCRRLRWLFIGLLAPEIPMLFAFAQRASAVRSIQDMAEIGHGDDWSIVHGFFADSGGFLLTAEDIGEPFPITNKQIVYLVRHGYIEIPRVTETQINDKSKADNLGKALAAFQAIRLLVILIARGAAGLHTTPFELATAAVVFCSMVTLFLWRKKPLDVQAPVLINAPFAIGPLAAISSGESRLTPLDFAEQDIYWSAKFSRRVEEYIIKWGLQARPFRRIPNDRDFQPSNFWENLSLAGPVCIFAAVHFCGWNLSFATRLEGLLWRINCVITWGSLTIYGVSEMVGFWRADYKVASLELFHSYKKRMPLSIIFHSLAGLYFMSRLCLVVEAIICLRDLPDEAFIQVEWTQWLPHF